VTWSRLWAGTPQDADVDGLVELRASGALGPGPPAPHLLALLEGAPVACAAVFVGDRRDGPAPAAWAPRPLHRVPVSLPNGRLTTSADARSDV
jgi:hypothetical protein